MKHIQENQNPFRIVAQRPEIQKSKDKKYTDMKDRGSKGFSRT